MAKEYKLNHLDSSGSQSSVIKVDTMTYKVSLGLLELV